MVSKDDKSPLERVLARYFPQLFLESKPPSQVGIKLLMRRLNLERTERGFKKLGEYLGTIAGRDPYSVNYVRSIYTGSMKTPGKILIRSLAKAIKANNLVNPLVANSKTIEVLAPPEHEIRTAWIMADAIYCSVDDCLVFFVPNHPSRTKCPICAPPRKRSPRAGGSRRSRYKDGSKSNIY